MQEEQTREVQLLEALQPELAEMEQRGANLEAENLAMVAAEQQQTEEMRDLLAHQAACGAVEQQETATRMEILEEQLVRLVALAGKAPSMAGRLPGPPTSQFCPVSPLQLPKNRSPHWPSGWWSASAKCQLLYRCSPPDLVCHGVAADCVASPHS